MFNPVANLEMHMRPSDLAKTFSEVHKELRRWLARRGTNGDSRLTRRAKDTRNDFSERQTNALAFPISILLTPPTPMTYENLASPITVAEAHKKRSERGKHEECELNEQFSNATSN
jgi:hypothetical protein